MTAAAADRRAPSQWATRPVRRVLVVDDVPEICHLYQGLFRRVRSVDIRGVFEIRGDRAVERLRSESFDLVITDVRMPGATGADVLAAARALHPTTPVILMSGNAGSVGQASAERGVAATLAKPLDTKGILDLLDRLLAPS